MKYTASITETGNHEADSSVIFRPHHSDVTCSNARRAESRTSPQICSCILLDHGRRTRPEVRTGIVSLHGSFKGFPCFGIRRGISHVLPGQKLRGSCDNWKKKAKLNAMYPVAHALFVMFSDVVRCAPRRYIL